VSRRPVIGITAYVEPARWVVWDTEATVLHQRYVDRVVAAGGLPVVLPPVAGSAEELLDRVDGVVLAGGADVDPARYAADPDPRTSPPRASRDEAEIALALAALDRGTPLLGICRGMQVLDVALGGTLRQHLPDSVGHEGHQPAPGEFGRHPVRVEPASRLAQALGRTSIEVHSYHHQALDLVADRLAEVAWAPDGTVEAVEVADADWALGVLWHPEVDEDPALFAALVDVARDRVAAAEEA
jgi:putative glutamine amidotransferase